MGVVAAVHEPPHDAGLDEHGEAAVGAALGEPAVGRRESRAASPAPSAAASTATIARAGWPCSAARLGRRAARRRRRCSSLPRLRSSRPVLLIGLACGVRVGVVVVVVLRRGRGTELGRGSSPWSWPCSSTTDRRAVVAARAGCRTPRPAAPARAPRRAGRRPARNRPSAARGRCGAPRRGGGSRTRRRRRPRVASSITSRMRCWLGRSSPVIGSSSSSRSGSAASAWATSTRWRCPPDSSPNGRRRRSADLEPRRRRRRRPPGRRRATARAGPARRSGPSATPRRR